MLGEGGVIQKLWEPPPPTKNMSSCKFFKTFILCFTFIADWLLTHYDMAVKMYEYVAIDHHEH
jgi:hypothetical protein